MTTVSLYDVAVLLVRKFDRTPRNSECTTPIRNPDPKIEMH